MTSFRQIEANRRNARKSTGPVSEEGKQRSRLNAVRHGLTAETVIGTLEDAQDYRAFEEAIISDYDAQSAVERELVLRLASLLWRLRRATTIETSMFEIEAEHRAKASRAHNAPGTVYRLVRQSEDGNRAKETSRYVAAPGSELTGVESDTGHSRALTQTFLSLANLPSYALDRLSRYEAILWRQVRQTLIALDALNRRKPHERRRQSSFGDHFGLD